MMMKEPFYSPDEADDFDEGGTIRWFGPTWNAPVNVPRYRIETPEGSPCGECDVTIVIGDQGIAIPAIGLAEDPQHSFSYYHLDCWLSWLGLVRSGTSSNA